MGARRIAAIVATVCVAGYLAWAFGSRLIELAADHTGRARTGFLSFELADAPPGPNAQERAGLWLARHAAELTRTEARFGIDRRAIAGAIAYEALADPQVGAFGWAARFAGPGKVHFREHRFNEGDPAAKQIEMMGLTPRLDMRARRTALARSDIAISYIGAIMWAFVHDDSAHGAALRCADAHLVTLYTAWKPSDFARRSLAHVRDNAAGTWTTQHLPFLTHAVGRPPRAVCASSWAARPF